MKPRTAIVVCAFILVGQAGAGDTVLKIERQSNGLYSSIAVDGATVFDGTEPGRVTIIDRSALRTVKRVFVDGKKVYEQSWAKDGTPIGPPLVSQPPRPSPKSKATMKTEKKTPALKASALRWRALTYVDVPYHRGGSSRSPGFNTAGLVWDFFKGLGTQVPRLLKDQAQAGRAVAKQALAVGDVLFFSSRSKSAPNMAGIYIGNNEMVYMSFKAQKARRIAMNTPYWERTWFGARRLLGMKPVGTYPTTTVASPGGSSRRQPAVAAPTPLPTGKVYQAGDASFYGGDDGLHGSPTASGETFNENKLTAAHRTLPFNTIVKVVRVDTGGSVTVKINDRGPFIHGRVIDLSVAAARRLRMESAGVVRVNLYIVKTGDNRRNFSR